MKFLDRLFPQVKAPQYHYLITVRLPGQSSDVVIPKDSQDRPIIVNYNAPLQIGQTLQLNLPESYIDPDWGWYQVLNLHRQEESHLADIALVKPLNLIELPEHHKMHNLLTHLRMKDHLNRPFD